MKLSELKSVALPALFKAGITPCLMGDRGIGKTEALRQYCNENGYCLAEFRAGQASDGGDLTGLGSVQVLENGVSKTVFALPNFLAQIHKKPKVVLFLDEFNRASRDIMQYLFELVYEKRIGINSFELGPDSHVVLAGNPSVKGMAVNSFDDFAFGDRVCQIKVENTVSEWHAFCAKDKTLDQNVINFFKENSEFITKSQVLFEIKASPSYRSAKRLAHLRTFVKDDSVFFTLAAGMVGSDTALAYKDYEQNNKVISANDVLTKFSSIAPILKKYKDQGQLDYIDKIVSNVLIEAEIRHNEDRFMSVEEQRNFAQFMVTLSPDTFIAFTKQLLDYPRFMRPADILAFNNISYVSSDEHWVTNPLVTEYMLKIMNKKMTLEQIKKIAEEE